MRAIAVIGAGSWGTALAMVLANNGHDVKLWARREAQVNEINNQHSNHKYLPDVTLPTQIQAYQQMADVVEGVQHIILVIPTKNLRGVLNELKACLTTPVTLTHGSKGIEPQSFKRVTEIIMEEMPASVLRGVAVLSGPSHAEEVSRKQPTTVTASSENPDVVKEVQDIFINQHFRVYTNKDMVGVELGGALKNIIALGAGISDGLGYGDNAKAALITRGLAEISRLGTKMGAEPLTFTGLAGMGDLIVTCTSVHSRNWKAGHLLGQGHQLDDVLDRMGMAVEGVRTTEAAFALAERVDVEMPITEAIYEVLFCEKHPKTAVDELMNRDKTSEHGGLTHILSNVSPHEKD